MATLSREKSLGDKLMRALRVTGKFSHDYSKIIFETSYKYFGQTAYVVFTSSFFILFPLFIEIGKEVVVRIEK